MPTLIGSRARSSRKLSFAEQLGRLAAHLRAPHTRVVVFEGAGVSVASGIGTFTGVGQGSCISIRDQLLDLHAPSAAHLAVAELLQRGFVDAVITTNHDRLQHRACGSTSAHPRIGELFGNAYAERCTNKQCAQVFQRATSVPVLGRQCEACGARLVRTGVRYGQIIPHKSLRECEALVSEKPIDVALVLGSSMGTQPLPSYALSAKEVFVVTLGRTHVDGDPRVHRLNAKAEKVMKVLMARLHIDIPHYRFSQTYEVRVRRSDADRVLVTVTMPVANEAVSFCETASVNGCEIDQHNGVFEGELTVAAGESALALALEPFAAFEDATTQTHKVQVPAQVGAETRQQFEFAHVFSSAFSSASPSTSASASSSDSD